MQLGSTLALPSLPMQSKLLLSAEAKLLWVPSQRLTPEPSGPAKEEPGEPAAERDPGSALTPASTAARGNFPAPGTAPGRTGRTGRSCPTGTSPHPGMHGRPHARPFPPGEDPNPYPNPYPNPEQVLFCPETRSSPSKGLVWGPHVSGRTGSIPPLLGMRWDELRPPRHCCPGCIPGLTCSCIPEMSFWASLMPATAPGVLLSYTRLRPQGGLHLTAPRAMSRGKCHCSKKETWEDAQISPASPAGFWEGAGRGGASPFA